MKRVELSPDQRREKAVLATTLGMIKPGQMWYGSLEYPNYLVADHGEIISLAQHKPRLIKPHKNKQSGYLVVGLVSKDGIPKKVYVHRLVCEIYNGPCPDGMECCHGDSDRLNNDPVNLRWDTNVENRNDSRIAGTLVCGEKSHLSKLSSSEIMEIRRLRTETGMMYKDLARMFNTSLTNIHHIVTNKTWTHLLIEEEKNER